MGGIKKLIVFALLPVAILIAIILIISKPNPDPFKAAPGAPDARPAKIAKAYFYQGGTCYVDSITPPAVSNLIAVSRKQSLNVAGWAITGENMKMPVPPMAYAMLNGSKGRYYFEGKRVPRPDVAQGNHLLDLAGYEVSGSLAEVPPGDYQLSIATGTEFVVDVCRTQMVVHITE